MESDLNHLAPDIKGQVEHAMKEWMTMVREKVKLMDQIKLDEEHKQLLHNQKCPNGYKPLKAPKDKSFDQLTRQELTFTMTVPAKKTWREALTLSPPLQSIRMPEDLGHHTKTSPRCTT